MPHVKITAPTRSPFGTEILIDGVEAQEVRSLTLKMEVDNVVKIIIEQFPSGIEFEGNDTDVERIVLIDGKRYRVGKEVS
ncbi:MAG: hypothetical protein WC294_08330 [Methanoregula sp.]|jgi:hypothetical protein